MMMRAMSDDNGTCLHNPRCCTAVQQNDTDLAIRRPLSAPVTPGDRHHRRFDRRTVLEAAPYGCQEAAVREMNRRSQHLRASAAQGSQAASYVQNRNQKRLDRLPRRPTTARPQNQARGATRRTGYSTHNKNRRAGAFDNLGEQRSFLKHNRLTGMNAEILKGHRQQMSRL